MPKQGYMRYGSYTEQMSAHIPVADLERAKVAAKKVGARGVNQLLVEGLRLRLKEIEDGKQPDVVPKS